MRLKELWKYGIGEEHENEYMEGKYIHVYEISGLWNGTKTMAWASPVDGVVNRNGWDAKMTIEITKQLIMYITLMLDRGTFSLEKSEQAAQLIMEYVRRNK